MHLHQVLVVAIAACLAQLTVGYLQWLIGADNQARVAHDGIHRAPQNGIVPGRRVGGDYIRDGRGHRNGACLEQYSIGCGYFHRCSTPIRRNDDIIFSEHIARIRFISVNGRYVIHVRVVTDSRDFARGKIGTIRVFAVDEAIRIVIDSVGAHLLRLQEIARKRREQGQTTKYKKTP